MAESIHSKANFDRLEDAITKLTSHQISLSETLHSMTLKLDELIHKLAIPDSPRHSPTSSFATNATHCVTSTAHCASSAALWAIGSFSLRHQPQPWSHQHRSIGPLLSGSKVDEVITLESRRGRQWRWRSLSPLLYYIKISWIGSMETRFHLSP